MFYSILPKNEFTLAISKSFQIRAHTFFELTIFLTDHLDHILTGFVINLSFSVSAAHLAQN